MTEPSTDHWELLDERDRVLLLRQWRDTEVSFPNITVPELFEQRVADSPQAVAVDAGDVTISYAELHARVNRLAAVLAGRGVRPGDTVGVLMARSADLVVTLFAVARAGAAYVPLDLRYPVARMRSILDRVGAGLLVVDESTFDHEVTDSRPVFDATGAAVTVGAMAQPVPDVTPDPAALLHIIHTSGSTGEPKGVAVTHRNVVALALDRVWHGDRDRGMLFHSPHAWDACTLEVLVPLLTGGRVVVLAEAVNAMALRRLVGAGRVTAAWLTAGLFNALAEGDPGCLDGAREVWTGGDVVSPRAVARIQAACPEVTIYNGYGPVETTVFATRYRVPPGPPPEHGVPIGSPMDNTRVYVLDDRLRLVPPGTVGQLHVGGAGVANGYAGRPDLTEERFLPDVFGAPGEQMYATGDLARWDADGNLSFAGRADGQVKVNGFRIEPGEIESVLAGHPAVAQAATVVRKSDGGGGRIVAYAVPNGDPPDTTTLLDHLGDRLPRYMVPAEVVLIPEIPLTPNGKVDRVRLAGPPSPLARLALAEPSPGHNLPAAVRLTGDLDVVALRAALRDVVDRHESMRTAYRVTEGEPRQEVADPGAAPPVLDVVRIQHAQLPKALAEVARREFDLAAAPLLRAALFVLSDQEHVLVLVLHRIIGDRASLDVLGADLATAYQARHAGRSPEWTAPAPRYSDAVPWPRDAQVELSDVDVVPVDHPRPAAPANRAGEAVFQLDETVHADMRALAETTGTMLPGIFQAGLAMLLAGVGEHTRIPIGWAVPGRTDPRLAGLVGPVERVAVLRVDASGDPTFRDLLDQVRTVDFNAADHPTRCQALLTVLAEHTPVVALAGTRAVPEPVGTGHAEHDLTFRCHGRDGVVEFNRDVFTFETAQRLADAFVRLLRAVAAKPDLRRSELPAADPLSTVDVPPTLADMWSELLEVRVSAGSASFWELGGHSLLGITLVARIRERFDVALRLRDLFRHPHLDDLARLIEEARDTDATPRAARSELEASSFQQRIWLAERLRPEPGLYNVPLSWRVSGRLDPARLAAALARTVERHEALRTVFVERDSALWQVVGPPWRPEVRQDRCASEAELTEWLRAEGDRPFDLAAGPLLRVGLIETPDAQHLTITVHHIVFDQASVGLLLADLDRYYRDDTTAADPPAQYRELVAATERVDPAGVRRRADRLRGAPSRLPLPAPDHVRPPGTVPLDLPADLLERMLPLQHRNGMSWFMVSAAAIAGALHRWTGSDDVTFGFPTDTRSDGAFAEVIGPCLNTVAVRSRCGPTTTVTQLAEDVRDDVLAAVDDQHVPFEAIVDALNPPRSADSTPYLDVVLAPQVRPAARQSLGGVAITPMPRLPGTSSGGKFSVSLPLTVTGERMTGALLYRGDRLTEAAVAEFARHVVELFDAILGGGDELVTVTAPGYRGPGSSVRERVTEIWTTLLGVDHVGVDDNFFDVGGNSLKLVTLHAELCREFQLDLPVQLLFENATVSTMSRFLTDAAGSPSGPTAAEPRPDERVTARRERLRRAAGR
jgi:amino acid adenylation domain-containing protein